MDERAESISFLILGKFKIGVLGQFYQIRFAGFEREQGIYARTGRKNLGARPIFSDDNFGKNGCKFGGGRRVGGF